MKNKRMVTITTILSCVIILFHPSLIFPQDISANTIGNKGLALIKKGEFDKGLKLVKKASIIEPEKPDWHMNYGSMLFTKGQSVLQAGNRKEGEAIFKEVEKELLLAIKLFKEEDNIMKSQCFFLIGDVYFFVFKEREKAQHSYQKALEHYPKHGGAMKAIKRFK